MFIAAPMVNHSDLPFRLLCRENKCNLVFTEMLSANQFSNSKIYREKHLQVHVDDQPLVVQFNGNKANDFINCLQYIEKIAVAVDINLGCPQNIAKRGKYGAFLAENEEKSLKIISDLIKASKIPVSVKIRISLKGVENTIKFCQELEKAGVSFITVHGRNRNQIKDNIGACNWEALKLIKSCLKMPVYANGGINCLNDVINCLSYTSCDGCMVAEALLQNPYLFCGDSVSITFVCQRYLFYCKKVNFINLSIIKSHLIKFLYAEIEPHEIMKLQSLENVDDIEDYVNQLNYIKKADDFNDTCYYYRHKSKSEIKNATDNEDINISFLF